MVKVKVVRDSDNHPLSVEVKGHVFMLDGDILCAAFHSTKTVLFALEDLLGLKIPAMLGRYADNSPVKIEQEKEGNAPNMETMLLG